jgi:hypothetical protein
MLRYQPALVNRTEVLGAVASASTGTTVTASGTVNTKGTWTLLGTSTFNYHQLCVAVTYAGSQTNYLTDIGVGDGTVSGTFVLIPDIHVHAKFARVLSQAMIWPLFVPRGATFYARTSAATASATMQVSITGASTGLGGSPGLAYAVKLYSSSLSAPATTTTPTAANAKSAWFQMSSGVPQRIGCLMVTFGTSNDVTRASSPFLFDIGAGATGSEQALWRDIASNNESASDVTQPGQFGPFAVDVPANVPFSFRCQGTAANDTDFAFQVAMHGLVV